MILKNSLLGFKKMNKFEIPLKTSRSGERNEVFDQYRLFEYLHSRIHQKIVKFKFSKPEGVYFQAV